jgi:hypothetical protein
MLALENLLGISKKQKFFTKSIQKPRHYNTVKQNIPLIEDKNFMADLLFLPETKQKYKYALVIIDLATDEFDIEPLRSKEPKEVLDAIGKINKRSYIRIKKDDGQSIRTDSGNEFKGVFNKYMYNQSILHRVAQPNRHIQVPNVERLNGILGRLFNGYMNSKEEETGKTYREWTDVIDTVRTQLNDIRRKQLPEDIRKYNYQPWSGYKQLEMADSKKLVKEKRYEMIQPKYKVGDLVYVVLESPEDTLGKKLYGNFRNGDYKLTREPHKIVKVLYYSGKPYYRYIVNSFNGVSYQEAELKPAKDAQEEKFKVSSLIGKKTVRREVYYKVLWKGYSRKEATWEKATSLIEDGLQNMIDAYNEKH